ncbi:MAG: hypothetical protein QNJ97_09510 [Myxococcota bacterium]|nr:hypothetical protein [Myxococcota bacterium]
MVAPTHEEIARAEQLVRIGDYREARRIAKQAAADRAALTPEDAAAVDRILTVTGIDPWVAGGFILTLGILIFLYVKYVL